MGLKGWWAGIRGCCIQRKLGNSMSSEKPRNEAWVTDQESMLYREKREEGAPNAAWVLSNMGEGGEWGGKTDVESQQISWNTNGFLCLIWGKRWQLQTDFMKLSWFIGVGSNRVLKGKIWLLSLSLVSWSIQQGQEKHSRPCLTTSILSQILSVSRMKAS